MRIEDLNELMDVHNIPIPLKTWEQDDFTGRDWGGYGAMIAKRLNAFPELLERVQFLERVAEQVTQGAELGVLTGMEDDWVFVGDLCPESFRAPDLAAYLRERAASDAGQEASK